MNQNYKNKLELYGMTHNQIVELKAFLVDRYVDNMSTKDLDDYGSKVDALVDSMGVTAEEVSTTHRRRDLDTL